MPEQKFATQTYVKNFFLNQLTAHYGTISAF